MRQRYGLICSGMCAAVLTAGAMAGYIATPFDGDIIKTDEQAPATDPGRAYYGDDLDTVMFLGADYLQYMQADITDDNAGNGTDGVDETPDDPDDGGWNWVLTTFAHNTADSSKNLYGVTALGLYYSYLESGNTDTGYFIAMTDAANYMAGDVGVKSASDCIFLMLYNDLPAVAGTTYQDAAKAKYDLRIVTHGGTATTFAEYIRDARAGQGYENGIIAWDIGAWARAAAMLDARYPGNGYDTGADDIAEVLYQDSFNDTPGYFDIVDDAGYDAAYGDNNFYWYNLGICGLIDAFDASGEHTAEIPGLVTILLASQSPDGFISYQYGGNAGDSDWQSTAYAMMTLGRLNQAAYQTEINLMGYWVAATQDISGGWVYSSGNHYPEIGGECTTGLYYTTDDMSLSTSNLELNAAAAWCGGLGDVDVNDNIVIEIDLVNAQDFIVGGSFLLNYDTNYLDFVSGTFGDTPFTRDVYPAVELTAGEIFYAVGVPNGDVGTTADTTMARITFKVLQEFCSESDLVTFNAGVQPFWTVITDDVGTDLTGMLTNLGAVTVDDTDPTISCPPGYVVECPGDIPAPYADLTTFIADGGTANDTCDPDLTFTLESDTGLVGGPCGGTVTRVYRVTDDCGNYSECTDVITVDDTIDPIIYCPPDIVVNADAGGCDADVDLYVSVTETFDTNPVLGATQAPGVWYDDRYPPYGFVSAFFDGDNRLMHSIDASDFNSGFYNTQGRKYDIPGTTKMSIDLYIPAAWGTTPDRRWAGFWGTAFDSGAVISGYPIVEFTSDTTEGSGMPRFRWYSQDTDQDPSNGYTSGWIDMGLPTGFVYDEWHTIDIELIGGDFVATVGDLVMVDTITFDSVEFGNVILQGHNTDTPGVTYDIYWDNFTYGEGPSAEDNCNLASLVGDRSDTLPLTDPYPSGVTTITWTATDYCGNIDWCTQTITVQDVNELVVDVELESVFVNVTRCITFDLYDCAGAVTTVTENIDFTTAGSPVNAMGSATILVPCNGVPYTCITARDTLHTLRQTDDALAVVGTQYIAVFTGADMLVGGNLNDDGWIDILDFGSYIGQYGYWFDGTGGSYTPPVGAASGDTPCGVYTSIHADITGDGEVGTGDFTYLQQKFLTGAEANCCGLMPMGMNEGPRSRISVRELLHRGLWNEVRADLNQDGWLDVQDMVAFINGARPKVNHNIEATTLTPVSIGR